MRGCVSRCCAIHNAINNGGLSRSIGYAYSIGRCQLYLEQQRHNSSNNRYPGINHYLHRYRQ